jgi:hypothetical protein
VVGLIAMKALLFPSQIEKPYQAWRWLVGSNPPLILAVSFRF